MEKKIHVADKKVRIFVVVVVAESTILIIYSKAFLYIFQALFA